MVLSDVCWCRHPSHGGWCSSGRPEPCECWVGDPRPMVASAASSARWQVAKDNEDEIARLRLPVDGVIVTPDSLARALIECGEQPDEAGARAVADDILTALTAEGGPA
jgi:hypothetical protein